MYECHICKGLALIQEYIMFKNQQLIMHSKGTLHSLITKRPLFLLGMKYSFKQATSPLILTQPEILSTMVDY